MADVSADAGVSLFHKAKCVLECFHIDKFRETQEDAKSNLVKGKDVLMSQLTPSGKFAEIRNISVIYGCNRWLSIFLGATYRQRIWLTNINEAHCIRHW